jgi:hypothetical protein
MTLPSSQARGLLRVAALLAVLGTAAACVVATRARAAMHELAHDAGARLLAYAEGHGGGARTLRVNGAQLHLLSGSTHDALTTVLDTYRVRCRSWSRLPPEASAASKPSRGASAARELHGMLDVEGSEQGFVACVDTGREPLQAKELLDRVQRVLRSGDLAQLGALRFVWATRKPSDARTHYVAVWADESLPLRAMFPAQGDAEGIDVPGLPRPPAARRVLSVFQEHEAPMIAAYESPLATRALITRYTASLEAAGFSVTERPNREPKTPCTLLVTRAERAWLAFVEADARSDASTVSLVPLR